MPIHPLTEQQIHFRHKFYPRITHRDGGVFYDTHKATPLAVNGTVALWHNENIGFFVTNVKVDGVRIVHQVAPCTAAQAAEWFQSNARVKFVQDDLLPNAFRAIALAGAKLKLRASMVVEKKDGRVDE